MAQQAIQDKFSTDTGGRFKRKTSTFRDKVTADGSSGFKAEAGRYHLYVSYACPWAHRTLITRALMGLKEAISVDVVDFRMREDGVWVFTGRDGSSEDSLHGEPTMLDVYRRTDPDFPGPGTVPVLFDKQGETIVNNESREIVRMFTTAFRELATRDTELLPAGREAEVDAMIDANYETVNNGVYKAGFAKTQEAYEEGVRPLFARLDELEELLASQDWLLGDAVTEADVCLWPTLARFDLVYFTHFKCNLRRIRDYPTLDAYTKRFHALPGVAGTCDWHHMKHHYFESHPSINPYRIVPIGPEMDLAA